MIKSLRLEGMVESAYRNEVGYIMIPPGKGGLVDSITLYNDGEYPITFELQSDCIDIRPFQYPVDSKAFDQIYRMYRERYGWGAYANSLFYLYVTPFKFTEPFKVGMWIVWRVIND